MNHILIMGPFLAQAFAMVVDEIICHRDRGLPTWERWGHPLDTLVYLFCLSIAYFFPPSGLNITLYVFFSIVSTLLITKDEWVHAKECSGLENWLHSLLFVLHPVVLITLYTAWTGIVYVSYLPTFLGITILLIFLFAIYQTVYWNFYDRTYKQ